MEKITVDVRKLTAMLKADGYNVSELEQFLDSIVAEREQELTA